MESTFQVSKFVVACPHQAEGTVDPMESRTSIDPSIALERIRMHQLRVVDAVLIPGWYWLVIAALTVAFCAVVDARAAVWTTVAAIGYAALVALLSSVFVFGIGRRVRVRGELLGERGAGAIVGFVGLAVGLSLAVGFSVEAAGLGHPALSAGIVAALVLVIGGPALMRRLRRLMSAPGQLTRDA